MQKPLPTVMAVLLGGILAILFMNGLNAFKRQTTENAHYARVQTKENYQTIVLSNQNDEFVAGYIFIDNGLVMQMFPPPAPNFQPRHVCGVGHPMIMEYRHKTKTQHVICDPCELSFEVKKLLSSYAIEEYPASTESRTRPMGGSTRL